MSAEHADPREAVADSIRATAARRIGRAFLPLALLVAAAVGGFALGSLSGYAAVGVAAGAPVVAVAFLVMGQGAVRLAAGWPSTGPWAVAGAAWVIPWGWALWVLVVAGVLAGRDALAVGAWFHLALATASAVLSARVLRDSLRIGELRRLAETMIVPAPEEG